MDTETNVIDGAVSDGVLVCPQFATQVGTTFEQARPQLDLFAQRTKGTSVLFLGAAISTFKPAQLPTWNDFVELLWSSALTVATSQFEDSTGTFMKRPEHPYLTSNSVTRPSVLLQ